MKIFLRVLIIAHLSLFMFNNANAQTQNSSIQGKISDFVTGNPVNLVTVYITNTANGYTDSVQTNSSGVWKYTFLTDVSKNGAVIPEQFSVSQNYPNPFNPSTQIDVNVPRSENVKVSVYNTLGQLIDVKEQQLAKGAYTIKWNARGSAGVYFIEFKTPEASITKKMVLLDGCSGSGLSDFLVSGTKGFISKSSSAHSQLQLLIKAYKFEYMPYSQTVTVNVGESIDFKMETIHNNCTLADLHNDILEVMTNDTNYHWATLHNYNNTDIPRLKTGGIDVQLFAAWVDPDAIDSSNYFKQTQKMIWMFNRELGLNTSSIGQAYTKDDVDSLLKQNKIAAILAVEGGHSIGNNLANLKALHDAGMRYMTITWNNSTSWAVSAKDSRSSTVGLSDFGKSVIRAMDSLGIMIDVAHTGIKTIEDILSITKNPIIDTHTGARALNNHYRDLYDDQIKAIAKTGGVIGVVFYPPFLTSGTATISTVVSHIDYIAKLVGVDYVAVGSDFDGIGTDYVTGLEDVSKYPALTYALLRKGYTQEDIRKILGGNFLRVFQKVCGSKKSRP